jgi:acyl-coenzyme A synthetase/AMP-(fatty) acid ligase
VLLEPALAPDLIDWFRTQFGVTVLDYDGSTDSFPSLGNYPHYPLGYWNMLEASAAASWFRHP